MGPAEECGDVPPPTLEEGELRGPMGGYPRLADARARPLRQRLLDGLEARADDVIQVYPREGVRWTGRQVRDRALQLAAGLQLEGVRPGDLVTVVCGRHVECGPLIAGTLMAGAVWAPLNHTFDDGDLRLLLRVLSPRVVLAEADVAARLRPLLAELEEGAAPWLLVTLDEGEGSAWDALATRRPREEWPELPAPPVDPRGAVAVIACSSGTSGLPKGVATSHFALLAVIDFFAHEDIVPEVNCKLVFTSPLFWVTGIWFTLLSMLQQTVVIYEYGCDEKQLLESIEKHQAPALFTANNFLLSTAKAHETMRPQRDLSSMRSMLTGGAAMSQQAEDFVGRVLGADVLHMYGLTELNGGIGITRRPCHKPGSVGTLGPFLRCKVVDPATGRACGPNEQGELRFKGPMLADGYVRNPQASAELFDARGWLRSGDLGLYDGDGFFYVTGRIKDTIKYRGAHVSPVDIEGVLEAHPAVLESAVVGVPDPLNQELPRAYVVLRPGAAASEEELCALVQERVAPHKWLRGGVVFLDSLPKSATGKISRASIRKQYVQPIADPMF